MSETGKRSVCQSETEISRLREQEVTLKNTLEKLKVVHEEVVLKSRTLEDRLSKLEGEEMTVLRNEHSDAKAKTKALKEKLSRAEKSLSVLKADKDAVCEQLRAEETARDKVIFLQPSCFGGELGFYEICEIIF